MAINRIGSDLTRPASGGDTVRSPSASKQSDGDEVRRVERSDRVDISVEGRELAARLQRESEGTSVGRDAVIRSRIERGYYNDPAIAERVAQRLWDSGDLVGASSSIGD